MPALMCEECGCHFFAMGSNRCPDCGNPDPVPEDFDEDEEVTMTIRDTGDGLGQSSTKH